MASILAQKFRDDISKHKDFRMKNESEFSIGYPTGFLNFDFKNGTVIHVQTPDRNFKYYSIGITDGSLVTFIGRTGCGKTTFVMQAAANIVRPFPTSCIFEDSIEGGVTETRKETLSKFYGDELKKRFVSRNTGITAENFYERMKMIYDIKMNDRKKYEYDTGLYDNTGNRVYKLEPTIYILDSLAMLMPEKYADEEDLSGQMAATAASKVNASIFKRIIPMLKTANIILFVINHILEDVDIGVIKKKGQFAFLKQGERISGGKTPLYLSNNIIRFDDNSKLKNDSVFHISGSMVDVSILKSRSSRSGQSTTMVLDFNEGFDPTLSMFMLLKEHERINGAVTGLYLADRTDMKFSQKNFKDKIANNPELKQLFMNEVIAVLKANIDAEEDRRTPVSSLSDDIMAAINMEMAV